MLFEDGEQIDLSDDCLRRQIGYEDAITATPNGPVAINVGTRMDGTNIFWSYMWCVGVSVNMGVCL